MEEQHYPLTKLEKQKSLRAESHAQNILQSFERQQKAPDVVNRLLTKGEKYKINQQKAERVKKQAEASYSHHP
jgi:hypothetical protein